MSDKQGKKPLAYDQKQFAKYWPDFQAWLLARGSAIFQPTNPYELARFLTDTGIGIVYIKQGGKISNWINGSDRAFDAFINAKTWRAIEKVNRSKKTVAEYNAIVARDGNTCMYCDAVLPVDAATIEHVVSIAAGGTNHLTNKTLACCTCNKEAGHLSVRQKIELAISKRKVS